MDLIMSEIKSMGDRAKECVNIIKKITDPLGLCIPEDSEPVTNLRQKMNEYIKSGEPWSGTVDFSRFDNRMAICKFPKWAGQNVEVTLRKNR